MFTFLEGQGVDDVISSGDHVTRDADDVTSDVKHEDGARSNDETSSPEPLATPEPAADSSANGLVTSSPTKSPDDVADLEFKGINILCVCLHCLFFLLN